MEDQASADAALFTDTTRAFLGARCPITVTRRLADDTLGYDPDVWRQGAELGWASLLADGAAGITGDGLADATLVARELGRLVAPGPFVPVNVVVDTLSRTGGHDEVLDELRSGRRIAAWSPVGPDGIPQLRLDRDDGADGWVLHGVATPVEHASGAAWLLATAADSPGGGVTQVLVPTDAEGVTVTPLGGLDLVRRFAAVRCDGVRVGVECLVGEPGRAAADVARQLGVAAVLGCAETVGALGEIFARTLDYLADRYSFGRPLNSYQALKHRCADDALGLQRCAATTAAATRALAGGAPDADELVSVAKAFVGPAATELVQDCVQLHGGIGVTWEHDLHLYLRRVTVNRMSYGTPEEHLNRVADRALGAVA